MLKPRRLQPGDTVAVVAPASAFERDAFDAGVAELRALGFVPVYDETVFARRRYLAGDPEVRAAALRRAWNDPAIRGVFSVRGGYGSMQVLPLLDPADVRRDPKVFVAYSDPTAILAWLTCMCGIVAFHGPMLAGRLGRGAAGYDRASLLAAVAEPVAVGEVAPPGLETLVAGETTGPLFGGTLTQLVSSLGTPFAFDPPNGHVLFLDEVGERPYRIDRMLTQLAQAGVLRRAGAIVFNALPTCDEPGASGRSPDAVLRARDVVADWLRDFPGPVIYGFPSGHVEGPAWTLPLGVRTRVIGDARPRLVIEEAAVV